LLGTIESRISAIPKKMVDSKTGKETMVRLRDQLGLNRRRVVDRGKVTSARIVEITDK
jgi:hypothetical protein